MRIKNSLYALLLLGVLTGLPADVTAEGIAEEQNGIISRRLQLNEVLPLEKVVLFTSGVGYFEHRGYIEGDTSLEVAFGIEEMSDILKSLVLQDFDGGTVQAVKYQPPESLRRKLRDFSFDLDENTSLYEVLKQARGEQVEVQFGDSPPITGRILGVETTAGGDTESPKKQISLYSEGNIKRFFLGEIDNIRFSDPVLQKELQEILTVLAGARRTEQRSFTLNFTGEGRREVMVGYIREMPSWKTTYRLVLGENEPPLLQGWAIAENTTNCNWNEVELKLVAGRPISFRMDLYSPMFVARPKLMPPVHKSAQPPLYEEGYSDSLAKKEAPEPSSSRLLAAPYTMNRSEAPESGRGGGDESYSSGIAPAASGAEQGSFFAYTIDNPVSIAKRSSALVPLVQQSVEAEALSVFGTQGTASALAGGSREAQRPLKSLHIDNTTGLHLMGGPITLFEQGMYAGDARFDDIVPKGKRLISYAEDLETQVVKEQGSLPEQVVNLSIKNGVFSYIRTQRRTTSYRLINRSDETRTIMVQHPKRDGWNLVKPEDAEEESSHFYRFSRDTEAGEENKVLEVVEEYPQQRSTRISNLDSGEISFYLQNITMTEKLRSALSRIQSLQQQINQLTQQKSAVQSRIDAIFNTQKRIRSNMEQLERDSRLYRQYVARLTEQEEDLEKLNNQISSVSDEISSTQKELSEFISTLDVEA